MQNNTYDALGRMLEAGAASAVAIGLSRGMNDQQLRGMLRQRFDGITEQQAAEVLNQGYRQSAAALALSSPAMAYKSNPADVPINPELFGDDAAGRRQRSIFIGTDADGTEIIRIHMDFPDITDPAEQLEAAQERMCLIIGFYPNRFPTVDLEECDDIDVQIIDTSRRF